MCMSESHRSLCDLFPRTGVLSYYYYNYSLNKNNDVSGLIPKYCRLHPSSEVRPLISDGCPRNDTKPSDDMPPVQQLFEIWRITSLPLLPGLPNLIVSVNVLSIDKKKLCNQLLFLKPFNYANC